MGNTISSTSVATTTMPVTATPIALTTSTVSIAPTSTASTGPVVTSPAHYVFTFGDSFTQTGFNISGQYPTQAQPMGNPPNPLTWSASGPNWLDDLILNLAPTNTLSYNFAVGWATVDAAICDYPWAVNPFNLQASNFINSALGKPLPRQRPNYAKRTAANAVFVIWFGVNDVDLTYSSNATTPSVTERIMRSYFNTVTRLRNAGALRFVFLGIPPLWLTPNWSNSTATAAVTTAFETWNELLQAHAAVWQKNHPKMKASFLDVQPAFERVIDDPTAFGAPDAICHDPDGRQCLWTDGLHPGLALHESVGEAVDAHLRSTGFYS